MCKHAFLDRPVVENYLKEKVREKQCEKLSKRNTGSFFGLTEINAHEFCLSVMTICSSKVSGTDYTTARAPANNSEIPN